MPPPARLSPAETAYEAPPIAAPPRAPPQFIPPAPRSSVEVEQPPPRSTTFAVEEVANEVSASPGRRLVNRTMSVARRRRQFEEGAASSSSWLKEDDAEDISDGAWNQTDGHADNPAAAEGVAAVEAHGAVRVSAPSEAELEAGRV